MVESICEKVACYFEERNKTGKNKRAVTLNLHLKDHYYNEDIGASSLIKHGIREQTVQKRYS